MGYFELIKKIKEKGAHMRPISSEISGHAICVAANICSAFLMTSFSSANAINGTSPTMIVNIFSFTLPFIFSDIALGYMPWFPCEFQNAIVVYQPCPFCQRAQSVFQH